MQLQRRLSGLERDLAAIQAKLDSLNKEADRLQDEKPEEAAAIREKITQITELWQELKTMVRLCSYLASMHDHQYTASNTIEWELQYSTWPV